MLGITQSSRKRLPMPRRAYRPPALRRDHARPRHVPAPSGAVMERHLTDLVQPATFALLAEYRRRGLREKVLTLPVMTCFLLALIWRQIPSVSSGVQVLARERMLWTPPLQVSQQAVSERLRTLPAALFRDLLETLLPQLAARAATRQRPLAPVITRVQQHFGRIWALDASALEPLFQKVGLLRDQPGPMLAGKLGALLDLAVRLPIAIWHDDDATVNERSFLDRVKRLLTPGTLLVLDKGFFGFALFDWCTDAGCFFLIPAKSHTKVASVLQTLEERKGVLDQIVQLGVYRSSKCRHPVRRVAVVIGGNERVYLTNVLDPTQLSPLAVVDLYARRWRIEDAFHLVKRQLGLSYVWTGASNGIQLQVWTTWLLYAVLLDRCDAVAEELDLVPDRISTEMVFRGLYHFTVAAQQGTAIDPVRYLASHSDLGIVKRQRKHRDRERLERRALLLNL